MQLKIDRLINPYKESNTYLLSIDDKSVVMIDLGNYPTDLLIQYLKKNNKQLVAVFLTHEHSDHCSGINELATFHDFDLYCSEACAINIENEKQNLSCYIQDLKPFKILQKKRKVYDGELIQLGGLTFEIMITPGHSPGGISIFVKDFVFTGDTILEEGKPYLAFPHSNKSDYLISITKLLNRIQNQTILPGHGDDFQMTESIRKKLKLTLEH
jgi:glyoxylase-like metal-dependent hydrolase (beta-lactamase superfamily II)